MDPVSLDMRLRPLRIGFLVDPNDPDAVRRVVRLAACLWGGTACPLIPVMDDIPEPWRLHAGTHAGVRTAADVTHAFLRFFEPDVFVETRTGQMAATIGDTGEFSISDDRVWDLSDLLAADANENFVTPIGVGMDDVYNHLFETTYQFKRRRKDCILRFRGGDQEGIAFFEAAYGMFPKGYAFSDYRRAYGLLKPDKVRPDVEQWGRIEYGGALCPFHFTRHAISFEPAFTPRPMGKPAFILDPLSSLDVVDFWNSRAIDPDLRPFNVHWLMQCREFVRGALELNRRSTERDHVLHPPTVRVAGSVDMELVRAAVYPSSSATHSGPLELNVPTEPFWTRLLPGMEELEIPTLTGKRSQVQVMAGGESDPLAATPVLSPDFASGWVRGPAWVNVLRPGFLDTRQRVAKVMPFSSLNERLFPGPARDHGFLSREGHVALVSSQSEDASVALPTMQAAILGWLGAHGIRATPSDAGRTADQVISAVGGVAGVPEVLSRATVDLLNGMAQGRERTAPLGRIRKTLSDGALDRLVRAGAVQIGLSAPCGHCQTENWYSLDDAGYTVSCERCLKEFAFPQAIPRKSDKKDRTDGRDRANWKYRVIGPFATPGYARGGYAVALTLAALVRTLGNHSSEITFSTGLELSRDGDCAETDCLAWLGTREFGRRPLDPVMVAGECKSHAANAFSEDDVRRLKTLAEWFPGAFLAAACLKESLGSDEVRRLRDLAMWGWSREQACGEPSRLIVLTGADLFSSNLRRHWENAEGRFADPWRCRPDLVLRHLSFVTQESQLGMGKGEIEEAGPCEERTSR